MLSKKDKSWYLKSYWFDILRVARAFENYSTNRSGTIYIVPHIHPIVYFLCSNDTTQTSTKYHLSWKVRRKGHHWENYARVPFCVLRFDHRFFLIFLCSSHPHLRLIRVRFVRCFIHASLVCVRRHYKGTTVNRPFQWEYLAKKFNFGSLSLTPVTC